MSLLFGPNGADPKPKTEPEPRPVITADEAAALIQSLHTVGLTKGYQRIRLDRGRHPDSGDHYELGYVHGEVTVRFSHIPNQAFRRYDHSNTIEFSAALARNARAAYEKAGR